MNEQPAEYLSQIMAFLFIAIAFISYLFGKPKTINLDNFEIGYISENPVPINSSFITPVSIIEQPQPKPIKTVKPKPKPKKIKKQVSPLQQDCIVALRSMGMKKSEAVNKVNSVFSNTQPNNIQEFIMEAFKREHN